MVMLPAAPLPVGVAVTVTLPVEPTSVPVAVVESLPLMVIIEVLLLVQLAAALEVKVTIPPEVVILTELPEHVLQVTVVATCPMVTGTCPLSVPLVAVMVTALEVLATFAVILPLLPVVSTSTCVGSDELQSTEPVKVLELPSSKFPVAIS
jgi:hypothetical protein